MVIKAIYFCFLAFPPNFAELGDRLVLLVGSVGPYHKALKRAGRKDSDINIQITTDSTRILQFTPKHPSQPEIKGRKLYLTSGGEICPQKKTAVLVSLSS